MQRTYICSFIVLCLGDICFDQKHIEYHTTCVGQVRCIQRAYAITYSSSSVLPVIILSLISNHPVDLVASENYSTLDYKTYAPYMSHGYKLKDI
jgi:hypothetical protein